jgi:hypothetical protein
MKIGHAVAALLLVSCQQSASQEAPGEIESVAPDVVLTFEYETSAFRLSAHRFSPRDNFEVVVQRPGHALRRCSGDAAFNAKIAGFFSLVRKRSLPDEEVGKLKPDRAFHRLRFATEPPLDAFDEVLSPLPNGSLSITRDGVTQELTLTTAAAENLAKSCQ